MDEPGITPAFKTLDEKIERLIDSHNRLVSKINELETQNADLRNALQQEKAEHDKTKKDVEFLILSHKLADDADNVVRARKKISALIKTIDNCIQMINED